LDYLVLGWKAEKGAPSEKNKNPKIDDWII